MLSPMVNPMPVCPECGHNNSTAGARYCAKCGGSLTQEPERAPEASGQPVGPSQEDVSRRLEELRNHPRYKEVMGMEIRGREVISHRVEGRRNGFFVLFAAVVGFVLYQQGILDGPLERFGVGPLFAVAALGLFLISRSNKKTHDLKGPSQSRESVVVAKRHDEPGSGPGRPEGLDDKFYVTVMDRQGVKEELSVKRSLYRRLNLEDAGAAYIKGRTLLRFETI